MGLTWVMVIVIGGQAFLSYDMHKTYEACDKARDAIAEQTFVASCMELEKAFGPPGTVR
jgi:hypothetical protein